MPDDRPFPFLPLNRRPPKPRSVGLTELHGPYYTPLGPRYLEDLLDTVGDAVDSLKFAGGSMDLYLRKALRGLIALCHSHHVRVSTGGFIEYLLTQGSAAVDKYLAACKELGF